MKKLTTIIALSAGSMILFSFALIKQTSTWVAPKEADATINPLKEDAGAITEGKKLYTKYCVVCHGDKGKGDGVAAASLSPKPADHSSEKVQVQSDGAIYWKMTTGKSPMASYAKSLTDTQRWQLVDYIRTLKKADKYGKAEAKGK